MGEGDRGQKGGGDMPRAHRVRDREDRWKSKIEEREGVRGV